MFRLGHIANLFACVYPKTQTFDHVDEPVPLQMSVPGLYLFLFFRFVSGSMILCSCSARQMEGVICSPQQ